MPPDDNTSAPSSHNFFSVQSSITGHLEANNVATLIAATDVSAANTAVGPPDGSLPRIPQAVSLTPLSAAPSLLPSLYGRQARETDTLNHLAAQDTLPDIAQNPSTSEQSASSSASSISSLGLQLHKPDSVTELPPLVSSEPLWVVGASLLSSPSSQRSDGSGHQQQDKASALFRQTRGGGGSSTGTNNRSGKYRGLRIDDLSPLGHSSSSSEDHRSQDRSSTTSPLHSSQERTHTAAVTRYRGSISARWGKSGVTEGSSQSGSSVRRGAESKEGRRRRMFTSPSAANNDGDLDDTGGFYQAAKTGDENGDGDVSFVRAGGNWLSSPSHSSSSNPNQDFSRSLRHVRERGNSGPSSPPLESSLSFSSMRLPTPRGQQSSSALSLRAGISRLLAFHPRGDGKPSKSVPGSDDESEVAQALNSNKTSLNNNPSSNGGRYRQQQQASQGARDIHFARGVVVQQQHQHQQEGIPKRRGGSVKDDLLYREGRSEDATSDRMILVGDSSPLLAATAPVDGGSAFADFGKWRASSSWVQRTWDTLCWCLRYNLCPFRVQQNERIVTLRGDTWPRHFVPNVICNQRYNVLTFLPVVLFEQFRYFFNLFYLLVALAQLVPQLRVGPLFTYIAPLSFVLLVTLLKEAIDDYKRFLRDREANGTYYEVLNPANGALETKRACEISVGDLVCLHADQRVPCDLVFVASADISGTTFVRTDQLDGEIDWKLRRAVSGTQLGQQSRKFGLPQWSNVLATEGWVVAEPPRKDIDEFIGTFYSKKLGGSRSSSGPDHSEGLLSSQPTSAPQSPTKVTGESETVGLDTISSHKGSYPLIDIETSSHSSPSSSIENMFTSSSSPPLLPLTEVAGGILNSKNNLNSNRRSGGGRQQTDDGASSVVNSDVELGHSSIVKRAQEEESESLSLENTLWANTVVTSGPVLGLALYTGRETRAAMNTSPKHTKMGLFDTEVNLLSKILFGLLLSVAFILSVLKGLEGVWYIYFIRFALLLSSIIPISLRVNLDLAKSYYAYLIGQDNKIRDTVVRSSTIPEELGRIDFLLTDKTGTLTKNDMVFKKLHVGRSQFGDESIEEIKQHLAAAFVNSVYPRSTNQSSPPPIIDDNPQPFASSFSTAAAPVVSKRRLEVWDLLRRTVTGLSVCHNVTPVIDEGTGKVTYQAASPDEVALVKFGESVGLQLEHRTDRCIRLRGPGGIKIEFDVIACFPFSSETKRMGILVKVAETSDLPEAEKNRYYFYLKGAENVMADRVLSRGSHWLQDECGNFARLGLRTLVLASKELSKAQTETFMSRYKEAQTALRHRAQRVQDVVASLEVNLELLALTGVEDKLQEGVSETLEALRHAGIRVWMLTGDKIETAVCIAISAGLKARQHSIAVMSSEEFSSPNEAFESLERFAMGPTETVLVVDGKLLELSLRHFPETFIRAACQAPSVICCRCSPTQKADVVRWVKTVTKRRTAAVGDGGNDVSMIQAADCGVGIVGKEGKQASLAADFSVTRFDHIHRLLLWHGRNCYHRSAKLSQFVIHRGLIIAVIQTIFSSIFFFIPMAIFQGWLTVGYATYYTMFPVFSLVLDIELPESVVLMFPELYLSLRSGRSMSIKTFFAWVWTSIYQGAVIMLGAILLFEHDFINIVAISFTSLVLSELLNAASEIVTWHILMVVAQVATVIIYFASIVLLPNYFNLPFILSPLFWWKVGAITAMSWIPLYVFRVVIKVLQPTRDSKLTF